MRKALFISLAAIALTSVVVSRTFRSASFSHKPAQPSGINSAYFNPPERPDGEVDAPIEEAPESGLTGALRGKIVDENDQPVYVIEVDLLPADKRHADKDERWRATIREWTGKNGDYEFSHLQPAEYFLSVGSDAAPTGKHPFAPSYYPGSDQPAHAEPVLVQGSMRLGLRTLRLRRLQTATIKVHVTWEDGTPVEWSNLLFHNPSFPNQGVIGDESVGVKDGEGEIVLPMGFDYYARAAVQCDAGAQIQSEESSPVQTIRIDAEHTPSKLNFVMPTKQCKLWSPHPPPPG
jgi:hypothetical protein